MKERIRDELASCGTRTRTDSAEETAGEGTAGEEKEKERAIGREEEEEETGDGTEEDEIEEDDDTGGVEDARDCALSCD